MAHWWACCWRAAEPLLLLLGRRYRSGRSSAIGQSSEYLLVSAMGQSSEYRLVSAMGRSSEYRLA
jgi:hypothetical protein